MEISKLSLEDSYNLLIDKLTKLKEAMVRNPNHPDYPIIKKTYWETREMAQKIAVRIGADPVAV